MNWSLPDDDFQFASRDDRVCRLLSVLAEFVSPEVARIRMSNPICDVYTFVNDSSNVFTALEGLVSPLQSGSDFRVDITDFSALLQLSHELENQDLLSFLFSMVETFLMLRFEMGLGTAFEDRFLKLRDSVASHFHKIVLNKLDIEVVDHILSSPSLMIENEDSLYDYIKSRTENDIRFSSLFEPQKDPLL